jgi:hypothetical protein
MQSPSRRDFLYLGLAASVGLARGDRTRAGVNVHQQLLEVAARQQEQRRARFAAVRTKTDLEVLQKELKLSRHSRCLVGRGRTMLRGRVGKLRNRRRVVHGLRMTRSP